MAETGNNGFVGELPHLADVTFDPAVVSIPLPKEAKEVPPSTIKDATDQSIIGAFTFFAENDPRHFADTKIRPLELVKADGTKFKVKSNERDLRRSWFDRLVEKGNMLQQDVSTKEKIWSAADDMASVPTKSLREDLELAQNELSTLKLDLETLDVLVLPEYRRHLVKYGYPDLRGRVQRKADRSELSLQDASSRRAKFFGKGNSPEWMENTIIIPRVVKA